MNFSQCSNLQRQAPFWVIFFCATFPDARQKDSRKPPRLSFAVVTLEATDLHFEA
jgi:hypothetical protein